ncbi:unnamed protein product [Caenorhabditis bovis]|uniref:glucuronosyltransferase n=1 Tax=Caenorhabditis bovis TaxID=2654633 RepID=A0A8S1EH17_9PELO|nr:unnamed protein product [Caenorhabditis bovis]
MRSPRAHLLLFVLSCALRANSAFNILVYSPRMMQSHVNFIAEIANVLAKHGHFVTVIDSVLRDNIGNALSKDVQNVVTVSTSREVTNILDSNDSLPEFLWRSRLSPDDQRVLMEKLGIIHREQCVHLLKNTNTIQQLKKHTFDFAIHEVFDVCGLGIFEALGIKKSIIASSTVIIDIVSLVLGITHPINHISLLSDYGSEIGILNVRRSLQFTEAMTNFYYVQKDVETMRRTNLLYTNSNPFSDAKRPWSRHTFEIGGIAFRQPSVVPQEYIDLIYNRKTVVLVSFGTAAPSFKMPNNIKTSLIKAMKLMPDVLFIWKYEDDDEITQMDIKNVVFKPFIPQIDLLETGMISLFITHGGQNSLLESFKTATKTLVVSLFGDQHRNSHAALEAGLIDVLPKKDLANPKKVLAAIRKCLFDNEKDDMKLRRIAESLRDAKNKSEELLLHTIEMTYSIRDPPDFSNYPKYMSPATLLALYDCFAIAGILSVTVFVILKLRQEANENEKMKKNN